MGSLTWLTSTLLGVDVARIDVAAVDVAVVNVACVNVAVIDVAAVDAACVNMADVDVAPSTWLSSMWLSVMWGPPTWPLGVEVACVVLPPPLRRLSSLSHLLILSPPLLVSLHPWGTWQTLTWRSRRSGG